MRKKGDNASRIRFVRIAEGLAAVEKRAICLETSLVVTVLQWWVDGLASECAEGWDGGQ